LWRLPDGTDEIGALAGFCPMHDCGMVCRHPFPAAHASLRI
jgi:hypothetical protein